MNLLRVLVAGSTVATTLCSPLAAQRPDAANMPRAVPPAADLRIPIHTAEADLGQPYGIWAAGTEYKVSFHDGMTFVPRLGGSYPHNQPLSWRTTSVRRGAEELLAAGERPRRATSDYRCEYRFAAFTEAYDVLANGLEQTFVFEELPGSGDLVITGAIDSLLAADHAAPAHQDLTFRDGDGLAIVRYGKAWVRDRSGARIGIATSWDHGEVTLRVPHRWLAHAELPIVVDPILATLSSIHGYIAPVAIATVDVGRDDDATAANVMTVWSVRFSILDWDVVARLTDDDYTPRGIVYSDLSTTWVADQPCCAYVGGADRWALVFRRHFTSGSAQSQLRCHVHASGDTTLGTSVLAVPSPTGNDWRPDVGGVEGGAAGTKALVVFQHENNAFAFSDTAASDVYGSLLDLTTPTGSFGSRFPIEVSQFRDSERPTVNQVAEGGASWSWVCALQNYDNSLFPEDWDLNVRRIGSDGSIASGVWSSDLASGGAYHQLQPVVEGNAGRYAVLFATADTTAAPGKITGVLGDRIWLERFDWAHGASAPDPAGDRQPVTLDIAPTRDLATTGLGFDTIDDSHFAALWISTEVVNPEPRYAICGYSGAVTEGPAVASTGWITKGACTFDNDRGEYRIVLSNDNPVTSVIWGTTLEYVQPPPTVLSGAGCSPTVLRWLGNRGIGSETERIAVVGAPAGSGHFVLVSLAAANQPILDPAVATGCSLLVSNGAAFLGTLDFQVGSTPSWSFALPEWLPPTTLYLQDWIFDGSRFAATQRLEVPVVR